MPLLSEVQINDFISSHDRWVAEGDSLVGEFEFSDFVGAMAFVTSVALLSEKAFHHPDIDIRWNTVTLRLSTHSEGGLTDKDTELAIRIDSTL